MGSGKGKIRRAQSGVMTQEVGMKTLVLGPERKEWHTDGKPWGLLHREDGPAVEYEDGGKEWWQYGKLHREDGPAKDHANGMKVWCINDKLHREDGPAFESSEGMKVWYINDMKHRVDGPAVVNADGSEEWWLNNERVDEETVKKFAVGK